MRQQQHQASASGNSSFFVGARFQTFQTNSSKGHLRYGDSSQLVSLRSNTRDQSLKKKRDVVGMTSGLKIKHSVVLSHIFHPFLVLFPFRQQIFL